MGCDGRRGDVEQTRLGTDLMYKKHYKFSSLVTNSVYFCRVWVRSALRSLFAFTYVEQVCVHVTYLMLVLVLTIWQQHISWDIDGP